MRTQVFIISLRAGGVGLNLTAANHVIHYDLW
jgi:SNF2 family DNA or RNA helicase